MNEKQNVCNDERFEEIGRWLGRSRFGRLLISVGIIAAFSRLAYGAWHDPEFSATLLSVGFLVYGLQLAWRVLPIPGATRTRWVQEKQNAERCPASYYRNCLWIGLGSAIGQFLQTDSAKPIIYSDYLIPVVLMLVGVVSHVLVRRFIRKERNI